MSRTLCHNCPLNGSGSSECVDCRRVDRDDIAIAKTSRDFDAESLLYADEDGATFAPPEPWLVERIRLALAQVLELDDIDILRVVYFAMRLTSTEIDARLRRLAARIGSLRGDATARESMARRRIKARCPSIEHALAAV